ncbi:Coq4 family protein [Phenylobacterium sp.]|uniref:Coq4 family protein n=1 Tax=Phenylobacterium sp. TaxID=1871053 RepID=UPI0025E93074|nr:Coq4 family protein [Phenylobacterium sp.]
MTMAADSPHSFQGADARPTPRPMSTRLDWGRALSSLRKLLADKDDTIQVFEIMRALNGASTAKGYHKLLATAEGGRMAYERKEFAARLMDDAWLDSLPPGSVGAAYRGFIREAGFSADGLADVSRAGIKEVDEPHPYAWFGRRTRDIHDVWHVLSGYSRDALGEACLVAFSYAQTRGLGWALIALGAASRARKATDQPMVRAIWQGYQRGKAAHWLLGEDYERLMAEPMDAARLRLGITPANIYDAIPAELRNGAIPKAA